MDRLPFLISLLLFFAAFSGCMGDDDEEIEAITTANPIETEEYIEIHQAEHQHPAPTVVADHLPIDLANGAPMITGKVLHEHPLEIRVQIIIMDQNGAEMFNKSNIPTSLTGEFSWNAPLNEAGFYDVMILAHHLPENKISEPKTIYLEIRDSRSPSSPSGGELNGTTSQKGENTSNSENVHESENDTMTNETREPDGHCLIVDNLTVNVTHYITLDLVNICDKDIHYPGVNATVDNSLVVGFSGMVEWYYLLFQNSSYNQSWQLVLDDSIPNGTEITLSFEAMILNCGEKDNWHDCPNSILQHTFIVIWPNQTGNENMNGYNSSDLTQFWIDYFFCQTLEDRPLIDDLSTSGSDDLQCDISIVINATHLIISSNGIPNHDLESTLACTQGGDCTSVQDYTWSIPRNPTNDTTGGHDSANCPEANGEYECAADRGSIAVAMNGVPIFGPEDGPGGDAVAAEHGAYNEDRQPIELGVCHGHAAQGGTYHYHADSNCMHWHPEEGENIKDDYDNSAPELVAPNTYDGNHSKVIGVAFDGYPIYGFWGYDEQMNVVEMKSSYELKSGETGYNGISDYIYAEGLGHLDVCNGHFGPTPDFPQGIYHYHSTMQNGNGDMGFPYFLICYRGEADLSTQPGGGQGGGGEGDPCAGHGETWGPGIGPPPEGCNPGPPPSQGSSMSEADTPARSFEEWLGGLPPLIGVLSLLGALGIAGILAYRLRVFLRDKSPYHDPV